MRYCGHFLIKAEGGAKNYKRVTLYRYPGDPLPSFSCSERVTIAYKMKKINSTREVGFHLCLKLKKRCIVGKKRATEVS